MIAQPLLIYATYPETAEVTATDSASGCDPQDVLQAEEDNAWQPANNSGSKSLTIDCGSPQTYGSLGIAGEYLNAVTLEVRASSDNFASSNVQVYPPTAINEFISAWAAWNNSAYRYWRLIFSGFGPSFKVAHVALCRYDLLPFFMDGVDLDAYQTEGSLLVSPDGHFLGFNRLRTMRTLDLIWGLVTPDEEFPLFQLWADACIRRMNAFFLVPDSSQGACHFAWVKPQFLFRAPWSNGLRNMPTIPVTARVP